MSIFSLVKFSESIPMHVRKLLKHADDYSKQDQWQIALAFSKLVLEELEDDLESDDRDVGLILTIAGFINTKVDKYDDAESFLKRGISVLDKYDGKINFVVGIVLKLVNDFYKNCQYKKAESFGRIAIEISGKPRKIETYRLADLNKFVGKSCLQLKKPDEAKKFLQAALSFYAKKFAIGSVEVNQIFESLEIAHFWKNNMAESKELFENSNEITDVTPLCSLGMLCEAENLPSKAINYYQRAVIIYESKGSPNDSKSANINLKLGKCYLKIGNYLESQICLTKSCAIYKKTLADDDPVMIDVKIHLALCCVKTARLVEARKLYEEILKNVYMDGSGVSILEWAQNDRRIGEDKLPIQIEKCDVIVPALLNLSALYILGGKYLTASTLQNFADTQFYLLEDDED